MSPSDARETAQRDAIHFSWLVKLRWAAMSGQLVTIFVVHEVMGLKLPLGPLAALLALEVATNVAAWLQTRRRAVRLAPWALPATMIFDTVLFTAMLYLTGGPFNPFTFLYLVQIALAAVVLPARWTWTLVVLSLACSAFLFFGYVALPLEGMSHDEHMRIHLVGMWVAFGVAASFIVHFLLRITKALSVRDAELEAARHLALRQEKLASLATLAAGTAHELATPLSTIALVAKELDRELSRPGDDGALETARSDAKLIREQVQRCRAILDHMSLRGGEFAAESLARLELSSVIRDALSDLAREPPIRLALGKDTDGYSIEGPPKALAMTLQNLLRNAQQASEHGQEVLLSTQVEEENLRIDVKDHGVGMDRAILSRLGEPFFTTKPPGSGMGLGIFVSRAMVERLGGNLTIVSEPAQGTCVTIRLPCHAATSCRIAPSTEPA